MRNKKHQNLRITYWIDTKKVKSFGYKLVREQLKEP